MQPVSFAGSNITFAKDQPEYLPLPAHKDEQGTVTTCWQLSLKERIRLFFSGRLFLTVLTFNTPLQPQLPSVHNPLNQNQLV
jgi:hypothetical protein